MNPCMHWVYQRRSYCYDSYDERLIADDHRDSHEQCTWKMPTKKERKRNSKWRRESERIRKNARKKHRMWSKNGMFHWHINYSVPFEKTATCALLNSIYWKHLHAKIHHSKTNEPFDEHCHNICSICFSCVCFVCLHAPKRKRIWISVGAVIAKSVTTNSHNYDLCFLKFIGIDQVCIRTTTARMEVHFLQRHKNSKWKIDGAIHFTGRVINHTFSCK